MKWSLSFVVAVLLLAGCGPVQTPSPAAATQTLPGLSSTPSPTGTPTPIPTFTPTPTPTPTFVPTPSPVPTAMGDGGAHVLTLNKRVFLQLFKLPGESNLFSARPDGSGLTPLTSGEANIAYALEDVSPDGSEIYWLTGSRCNSRGLCGKKYFNTRLDGRLYQQVWPWLLAGNNTISLSPDGKLIAYSTFFGGDPASRPKNKCFIAKVDGNENIEIDSSDCGFLGTDSKAANPGCSFLGSPLGVFRPPPRTLDLAD